MAVELPIEGECKLPDDGPEAKWREHRPRDQWTFTSATEVENIKDRLSSQRLTHYLRDHYPMDDSLDY
jgi:uroporphyrinogen-III synthase